MDCLPRVERVPYATSKTEEEGVLGVATFGIPYLYRSSEEISSESEVADYLDLSRPKYFNICPAGEYTEGRTGEDKCVYAGNWFLRFYPLRPLKLLVVGVYSMPDMTQELMDSHGADGFIAHSGSASSMEVRLYRPSTVLDPVPVQLPAPHYMGKGGFNMIEAFEWWNGAERALLKYVAEKPIPPRKPHVGGTDFSKPSRVFLYNCNIAERLEANKDRLLPMLLEGELFQPTW